MASKNWQLATEAAARYQEILVPAILGPFAEALVDWVTFESDDFVVDVGCGSGAAARAAAGKLGEAGRLTGVDINEAMLSVAGGLPVVAGAPVSWEQGDANALPMDDETVSVVLCAQVLQFTPGRAAALAEMHRVLKPGGTANISLWCDIDANPYFEALVNAMAQHVDETTAGGLGAAFGWTDRTDISQTVHAAGFSPVEIEVVEVALDLPPLDEFVPRHVSATPMSTGYNAASTDAQAAVIETMRDQLTDHVTENGVTVPFRSWLVRGVK